MGCLVAVCWPVGLNAALGGSNYGGLWWKFVFRCWFVGVLGVGCLSALWRFGGLGLLCLSLRVLLVGRVVFGYGACSLFCVGDLGFCCVWGVSLWVGFWFRVCLLGWVLLYCGVWGFWTSCFVLGWFLVLFRCRLLGLRLVWWLVLVCIGGLVLGWFGDFVVVW